MTTATAPLAPAGADEEDVPVLHGRRLRPGATPGGTPRFADDTWRLDEAILQRHARSSVLDFTALPARYRLTAKHLCYAMLSGPLPPGERRAAVSTLHAAFGGLKRFLAWLDTYTPAPGRPAGPALADLGQSDLENFQLHLLATVPSPGSRQAARWAVRLLWGYRHSLPGDRLTADPRHADGWGEPTRRPAAENATDRIPEEVFGPLLAWSLRFVDDFAPDILAAAEHRKALHAQRRANPTGRNTGASDALLALLAEHLRQARPLPGHRGQPNVDFLALTLGCSAMTLKRLQPQIDAAAAVVGVHTHSWFSPPITGRLDGQPWVQGIATDPRYAYGLAALSRMLQAAAYTTLAFLSGMRDSENRAELHQVQQLGTSRIYR